MPALGQRQQMDRRSMGLTLLSCHGISTVIPLRIAPPSIPDPFRTIILEKGPNPQRIWSPLGLQANQSNCMGITSQKRFLDGNEGRGSLEQKGNSGGIGSPFRFTSS